MLNPTRKNQTQDIPRKFLSLTHHVIDSLHLRTCALQPDVSLESRHKFPVSARAGSAEGIQLVYTFNGKLIHADNVIYVPTVSTDELSHKSTSQ